MRILFVAFIILLNFNLRSQDTLLILPTVEIIALEKDFTPFSESDLVGDTWMNEHAGQSISTLLGNQSGLLIRSFSSGGLASPAARGGAARHTSVVWNGINLQSPLNGTIDLSLFPVEFLESVAYHPGGVSSLFGSGSFGGSVQLNNQASSKPGLTCNIGTTIGSFGLIRPFARINFANERYHGQIRSLWSTVDNDFKIEGKEVQIQAKRTDFLLSQENSIQVNARNQLKTYFWRQLVDRELPPSRVGANREEYQLDSIFRVGLEWEHRSDHQINTWRLFYLNEGTDYGSQLVPASVNKGRSILAQYTSYLSLDAPINLRYGLQYRRDQVNGAAIASPSQDLLELYGAADQSMGSNWNLDYGFRIPIRDWSLLMPALHVGLGYQPNKESLYKFGLSYNYTLPTLNDLYWSDAFAAGNPNLKPEQSIDLDFGTIHTFAILRKESIGQQIALSFRNRVFTRYVRDWIIWRNQGLNGVWSPSNLQSVFAHGLESRISLEHSHSKWSWGGAIFGSFIRVYEAGLGDQLAQQPYFRNNIQLWFQYNCWRFSYQDQFLGKRAEFVSQDPSENLLSQYLAQAQLSYNLQLERIGLQCFVRVGNVWNTYRETFRFYPIPGRNFQIGFLFNMSSQAASSTN